MKVFLSWSGTRSRLIAESFHEWLPNVIQAVRPWMSASDIDKGARWGADIALQLEETRFGIICLTPENLESPWILFEAGALSKTLEKTYVCPYLFKVESTDLKGPLVQFQTATANKEDTRRLIQTINQALDKGMLPETKINKAFEVWWLEFESKLRSIPELEYQNQPHRSERDLLKEILDLVRAQSRGSIVPPSPTLQEILALLEKEPNGLSASEIAERLRIMPDTRRRMLNRLINAGLIKLVATQEGAKYRIKQES